MELSSIIPAQDWFFITGVSSASDPVVEHVAAWGILKESGEVVGMMAVASGEYDGKYAPARLTPIMHRGQFKPLAALTTAERKAARLQDEYCPRASAGSLP